MGYYEDMIKRRRPYFNSIELKKAAISFQEKVLSTGYICPIDAAIEQINVWYPDIIKKRPIEEYGIQSTIDFVYTPLIEPKPKETLG